MPGRRNFFLRLWDAIAHPQKWQTPDVVSEEPILPEPAQPAKKAQPPAKRAPAKRVPAKRTPTKRAPAPAPAPVRQRIVPRNALPASWGPNKAALWQEATRHMPVRAATDWEIQALYDAALYSFSETQEVRHLIQEELFNKIWEKYGVDFRLVFDWQGYREAYDAVATRGEFADGGELNT